MSALRALDLGCQSGAIEQSVLQFLAAHCPNVLSLNLDKNEIKDGSMQSIIDGWPHLEELSLFGGPHSYLSDGLISDIVAVLRNLRMISIDRQNNITDTGVEVVAKYCAHTLERIYLYGRNLTDLSLLSLTACKHLQLVSISDGSNFTDMCLLYLQEMPALEHLHFVHSKRLTNANLSDFFWL